MLNEPILKVKGKANLDVGISKVVLSTGLKPTMEEYVSSTETK